MKKNLIKKLLNQLGIKPKLNSGVCAGGKWLKSHHKNILNSTDPTTESVLSNVAPCTEKELAIVIKNAQQTFLDWRSVPAPKRGELVRQIGEELRKNKEALATLITLEMGKLKQEALGEVQEMIDMADFAVGQARMLYGLSMHSERPQHRMFEQWQPLGIVGIITAFNFPVAVWAWNAFIAVICGNTVIWKPSSKTFLCALAVQNICNKVMHNNNLQGIFSLVIFNDKQIADKFLNDPLISLVSFTGSTKAGKHIAEKVTQRLGKTLLELGGNNAIIIDESADLELATRAVLFSAVGTAGQRCTTVRRLIVHEKIYHKIISKLIHAYHQIKIGDPLSKNILMGPLVDKDAVEIFCNTINKARTQGGKILVGGKVLKKKGCFVEPTIITAENDWDVVQHENFAPILFVMRFKKFSEAVKLNNQSAYGLSSALFTNDLKNSEYFLSALGSDCGIANINIGTSGAEIGGAFGGEKHTGGGREAGSDAWKAYMRRQTNTINWSDELPLAQGIKFDV